jgi:hypothetical protein
MVVYLVALFTLRRLARPLPDEPAASPEAVEVPART